MERVRFMGCSAEFVDRPVGPVEPNFIGAAAAEKAASAEVVFAAIAIIVARLRRGHNMTARQSVTVTSDSTVEKRIVLDVTLPSRR